MKIILIFFCKCGAGAEGEVGSLQAAEKFHRLWYEIHNGPGHADCEKEEAARVFNENMKAGSKQ